MMKSVTYREITVAVGVLVALLIALILWIGVPQTEKISADGEKGLPVSASLTTKVIKNAFPLLRFVREQSNPR